jgi:cytochrome P450
MPLYQLLSRMMLFSDPSTHTRLGSLATRAFTPRIVEGMRPRIQQVVDELLDARADAGHLDVIADLAYPLPVTIIMELLGLPVEDRPDFKRWSDAVIAFSAGGGDPDHAADSAQALTRWITRLAADRRAAPRDDLLSALVAAEEQGDRLSGEELLANVVLLLMNGHETTTFMIANAVRMLLLHPDQLQALRNDPGLLAGATDELLRYDGSVQMRGVSALEDLAIGGKHIRRGVGVWIVFAAANRDPEQFPDPDRLDVRRNARRHLDFGYGAHFCIAAALARAQIQISLDKLLQRFPDLRLATDEIEWHQIPVFRGPTALLVAC